MAVNRFTGSLAGILSACVCLTAVTVGVDAGASGQAGTQAPPTAARGAVPTPDPTKPQKLDIQTGTKARYRVTEQLAGISFPSDAVGTTESITGAMIVNPDGSFAAE